jgi:5'(3')-deoxyribonucleotidase
MTRKIIAVDVDDVLAASAEGWIEYTNQRWGMDLKLHEYDENWRDVWGVDHAEGIERAHAIYESGIQGNFDVKEGAREVLLELSERFDLVITTSRVLKIHDQTMSWLEKYFGGIFKDVHLAGFYETITQESFHGTKADLIAKIGADYLIDDQP